MNIYCAFVILRMLYGNFFESMQLVLLLIHDKNHMILYNKMCKRTLPYIVVTRHDTCRYSRQFRYCPSPLKLLSNNLNRLNNISEIRFIYSQHTKHINVIDLLTSTYTTYIILLCVGR